MSKLLMALFCCTYLIFNYLLIPYLPNPILFGWMPLQMACYLFSAPLVAVVWGLYFHHKLPSRED